MNVFNKIIAFLLLGLSATPALAITNNQVFAYAEANYASLFAGTATSGQYQQYYYRYYPATGNYLAVDTSGIVYILGPVSGGQITSVGTVSAFEGAVTAWEAAQASTAASLSSSLQGTWKMKNATPSGSTTPVDMSAIGLLLQFSPSTLTITVPAAVAISGVNIAACTESDSWTLNGNALNRTVTSSSVGGSTSGLLFCESVGTVGKQTVSLNGNTLTLTGANGYVETYELQSTAPSTSLSTSLLGTWKNMTSASSGGTASDVTALGLTVRIDASTYTLSIPTLTSKSGATYAACTETRSWTLNGNALTTTVTASPGSGTLCAPVGRVRTDTVAVNGNTLTTTSSEGFINTYSLQSPANSTTPAANTTTPSTGTAPSSTGTASAGTSWSLTNISGFSIPSLNVVRYLNKQWIAAGNNSLLTLNGNLINDKIIIPTSGSIYGAAYGNGLYVAVGDHNTIITSPDATSWTSRVPASQGVPIYSITYGNGIFVAVSSGKDPNSIYMPAPTLQIQTSTDGITWNTVDMSAHTVISGYSPSFSSVTFGNGQFVAVGKESINSGSYPHDAMIFTSTDGVKWVNQNTGLAKGNEASPYSVRYAGGQYVVVGNNGLILTSLDGINWTKRTAVTPNTLFDVAYGNGKYVAVGYTGTMIESRDGGVTWTALPALTTQLLSSIDFANNQFVVVGDRVLITSP